MNRRKYEFQLLVESTNVVTVFSHNMRRVLKRVRILHLKAEVASGNRKCKDMSRKTKFSNIFSLELKPNSPALVCFKQWKSFTTLQILHYLTLQTNFLAICLWRICWCKNMKNAKTWVRPVQLRTFKSSGFYSEGFLFKLYFSTG